MNSLRRFSLVLTLVMLVFGISAFGDGCDGVEEECMVVTGEAPTCPEGFVCFTPYGNSIWQAQAYVPEVLPSMNDTTFMDEVCKVVDEFNQQACEAWRKKKEIAKEIEGLPECNTIVYDVGDSLSFSGVITGGVSGWRLLNDPDAKIEVKLKKVVTISLKSIAKVSIATTVAGEVIKQYCKVVGISNN